MSRQTSTRKSSAKSNNRNTKQSVQKTNTQADDDSVTESESPIPQELLEAMPEPVKERISQSLSIMSAGPMINPISKKVTPEHIDKIIENDSKENERIYEL